MTASEHPGNAFVIRLNRYPAKLGGKKRVINDHTGYEEVSPMSRSDLIHNSVCSFSAQHAGIPVLKLCQDHQNFNCI